MLSNTKFLFWLYKQTKHKEKTKKKVDLKYSLTSLKQKVLKVFILRNFS